MTEDHINVPRGHEIENPNNEPCSCGRLYACLDKYTINDWGIWYNCACHSTRLIQYKDLKSRDKAVVAKCQGSSAE